MAREIERKFLLACADLSFLKGHEAIPMMQGYLHSEGMTSRVRIAGDSAYLTLKGKAQGITRDEYEYPIPLKDAEELMTRHTVGRLVSKTRYRVRFAKHIWEVDVFGGHLAGLVVAEIELTHEEQTFRKPKWVGLEVTHIKAYSNKNLARAMSAPLTLVTLAA